MTGKVIGKVHQVTGTVQPINVQVSDSMAGSHSAAPSPRRLRAFLCHTSADKNEVRALYQRLTADGIDAWFDEEDLLPGQDWEREIRRAVRAADVVLVCVSPRSINKAGFVQKEITFALGVADEQPEGVIFVIPLRLEECQVPDRLRQWQWVDLFQDKGYEKLFRALRDRATSHLIEPPQPASEDDMVVHRDKAIERFARSATFRDAKRNAVELVKCEPFSAAQIDRILIAATTNDQIYSPDELRRPLKTLVARYGHLTSPELRDRFFKVFNV